MPASFPTTTLLDDFNRADNASSLGANWTDQVESGYSSMGVINNQAYSATTFQGNYWSAERFNANQECYVTLPVIPVYRVKLYVRLTNPGGSYNAYYVNVLNTGLIEGGLGVGGVGDYLYDMNGPGGVVVAGDSIGIRVVDSTIEIWLKHDMWTKVHWVDDNRVTGSGYIGMHVGDETTVRVDNFGGGNYVSGNVPFQSPTVFRSRGG